VQAAQDLFGQRGYAGVSVEDIAARAGVAAATVYAAGGKRELLDAVIEQVVTAGTGVPVGADPDGPKFWEINDVDELIRVHVANIEALKRRGAAAHSALWRAASSDPEVAALWTRFVRRMYGGQMALTTRLSELGALRRDLDPRSAADILQALARPETYDAMVLERGWTIERWIDYLEDAIRRLLLAS
jgi:AcrR family transcriptional regulator